MERQYYVERDRETCETSDRLEAARIAAEWIRRGYKVETIVVDVTDDSVQRVDDTATVPGRDRIGAAAAKDPGPPAGTP